MRVVLRNDIAGVGRRGDLVDVADGYARNYLLPGGSALEATEGIEAQAQAMRRSRDLRDTRDREAGETKARVLAGATVTVQARAGSAGRLFGSVGVAEVIGAVREQLGVELMGSNIRLEDPIKTVGSQDLQVALHHDVVTVLTVVVEAA